MKPGTNTAIIPIAAKLATTPKEALEKKTVQNAWLITHLENQIRAERLELDRLLTSQTSAAKRERGTKQALPPTIATRTPSAAAAAYPYHFVTPPGAPLTPTLALPPAANPCTPDLQRPKILSAVDSPVAIMHAFDISTTPYQQQPLRSDITKDSRTSSSSDAYEMAARGSHWSFAEKERFEAALQKYGPFSWPEIISTVGTRSEKQVKAYAARYRRRKKLAATSRLMALCVPTPQSPAQPIPQAYSCDAYGTAVAPVPSPPVHTHPTYMVNDALMTQHHQSHQTCSTDSTAVTPSVEASVDNNVMSEHRHCELPSSSSSPPQDLLDIPSSDATAIVGTAKVLESNILDDAILASEEASVPLGVKLETSEAPTHSEADDVPVSVVNNPSEVDLLFDQALRGELVEEEKPFTTPEMQVNVENSSLDCINSLFMTERRG